MHNLSPQGGCEVNTSGNPFSAHEGQEGDLEQPAWIYQGQVMPN